MDALSAAAALLPDLRVAGAETLRRSDRSEVLRVRADGPGWPGPPTLIVKLYPDAGQSWARETAALAAMPGDAPVPRLIAARADPPGLVMTDAGTGPSLATALLGSDPAQATAATVRFAEALAALHLATQDAHGAFAAELAARSAGTVPAALIPALVTSAAATLDRYCGQLGVAVPPGSLAELTGLPARLSESGPSALTLADACPDNNVRTPRGYLLIDFEEAEWRPAAWDVAYLTVPWPSCWCCFTLPPSVTRQAVARYRSAAAGQLPYLGTPAFGRDVALATAGWALVSSSWFLGHALGENQPFDSETDETGETDGLPTRRAVIAHRLAAAQHTEGLPALAALAGRLRAALIRRWGGEPPLRPAPAFRPGTQGPAAPPPG
jgi:phosphotransferase family enzyme